MSMPYDWSTANWSNTSIYNDLTMYDPVDYFDYMPTQYYDYVDWSSYNYNSWTQSYYQEVNWGYVDYSDWGYSQYESVNWGYVDWNDLSNNYGAYEEMRWEYVEWSEVSYYDYSSIDWGYVGYSSMSYTSYTEINWSYIEWNEFGDYTSYQEINWNYVEWNEFAWNDWSYVSGVDWNSVEYDEMDYRGRDSDYLACDWNMVEWSEIRTVTTYREVRWEYVEFSELDSGDLSTIRRTLSQSTYSSVTVEIGRNTRDSVTGGSRGEQLFGLKGSDTLDARGGNDKIFGCFAERNGGRGEIDTMWGRAGRDTFVLGTQFGVLYDDGRRGRGLADYALVKDFTRNQDRLQLHGSRSDYFLGASPVRGVSGQGLFHDSNNNNRLDRNDELIAVLQGGGLNRSNTINKAQFVNA